MCCYEVCQIGYLCLSESSYGNKTLVIGHVGCHVDSMLLNQNSSGSANVGWNNVSQM